MSTATRPVPKPGRTKSVKEEAEPPEAKQPEATDIGETQGQAPNTQTQEEEPKEEKRKERSIKVIAGELEQEMIAVASLEIQIRNRRDNIVRLRQELDEAMAPGLRTVGISVRSSVNHAGTGLPLSPREPAQRRQRASSSNSDRRSDGETVRLWLKESNWVNPRTQKPIGDMGPIPKDGYEAYDQAHAA